MEKPCTVAFAANSAHYARLSLGFGITRENNNNYCCHQQRKDRKMQTMNIQEVEHKRDIHDYK